MQKITTGKHFAQMTQGTIVKSLRGTIEYELLTYTAAIEGICPAQWTAYPVVPGRGRRFRRLTDADFLTGSWRMVALGLEEIEIVPIEIPERATESAPVAEPVETDAPSIEQEAREPFSTVEQEVTHRAIEALVQQYRATRVPLTWNVWKIMFAHGRSLEEARVLAHVAYDFARPVDEIAADIHLIDELTIAGSSDPYGVPTIVDLERSGRCVLLTDAIVVHREVCHRLYMAGTIQSCADKLCCFGEC